MNTVILLRLILIDLSERNYLVKIPVISMQEFATDLISQYSTFEVEPSSISSYEYYEFTKGKNSMKVQTEDEIHEILKPFKKEA
jgi:hypothetical protein